MNDLMAAFSVEWLKIVRSKVLWIVMAFFIIIPVMMGILMLFVKYPDLAGKMGMIASVKAEMIGDADWPTMFKLMGQIISVGGIFGFGFITSWVFGREYSERTLKDLIALPISRTAIVSAKFAVIFICCAALSILMFSVSIVIGKLAGLGELTLNLLSIEFIRFEISSLLLIALCTPVAFFANAGRGYMLPLGCLIILVIIAQFVGALGLAPYFPWAIPALYFEEAGGTDAGLSAVSYAILFLTCALGFYLTQYWWNKIDQI